MFETIKNSSQPPPVNADPLNNNATAAGDSTLNVKNPIQDQQAVEVATKEDPLGAIANQILQELPSSPSLWNPPTYEYPPSLQYLCNDTIYKDKEMLSNYLKLLPSRLREDVKEFERKRDQVKIKYEELLKNGSSFLSLYLVSRFLCSIRLSQVYKELYTKLGSGELNGVILPSTDEDDIKSLLFTAEGRCTCFRISVDIFKTLYTKYDIKAISVAVPSDAIGNRECSLEDLPREIEIALIGNESGSLVYNHPLCKDVIRFGNCEELVKYINTLVNYVG